MNDLDHQGRQVLGPLAADPPGPPRYDLTRAMAEGRRRRRSRRLATGTAAVAVTATTLVGGTLAFSAPNPPAPRPSPVVSSAPARPVACTVTRLTAAGRAGMVLGSEPTGRWLAGWVDEPGGRSRSPVLWEDGEIVARPRVTGIEMELRGVNSHGTAAGFQYDPGLRAVVYTDGRISTLAGKDAVAEAVNDAGVVAGSLGLGRQRRPVRWSSVTARPEILPVPAGATGVVLDIDAAGTMTGLVWLKGSERGRGFLWLADGTTRLMPVPEVDGGPGFIFNPSLIRNGWVIGYSMRETDKKTFTYVRYRIDTGRYEAAPAGAGLPAYPSGGGAFLSRGTGGRPTLLTADGQTVSLPAHPDFRSAEGYLFASLSLDGTVASANLVSGGRQQSPALWRCR